MSACADTAGPAPTPANAAVADSCPITVLAVLPVGNAPAGTTYAAFLASPDGPGEASGTLWVNTPDGAFHVSFERRGVTNRPYFVVSVVTQRPAARPERCPVLS